IIYQINPEILAMGALPSIERLLTDDSIEEIMYNSPDQPIKIIHREHHMIDTNVNMNLSEAREYSINIAVMNRKYLTEASPVMDGSLPDGSRINITIPPATSTITFTIRKFSHNVITVLDMINQGMIDAKAGAFLWTAVEGLGYHAANILVVGGTSSGKTTFLNGLSILIPLHERIITIEDTPEIRILHENKVPMFSSKNPGATMDDLLKNALRMRPDRIIVGEVRGEEAKTLFSAMNTGHNGCMGTIHATSARETVTRIKNPPLNVPISMLSDLDLLVVMEKISEKRTVSEITEIEVLSGNQPSFNQIYKYDPKKSLTLPTGIPSKLRTKIAQKAGLDIKSFDKIIEDRENILSIASKKHKLTNSLSTSDVFMLIDKNKDHWKKYKGRKRLGILKRKEEELIDW
ncbi:MAG: CpaF family protein, partial [Candidatus Woesearchaeota archaeon]